MALLIINTESLKDKSTEFEDKYEAYKGQQSVCLKVKQNSIEVKGMKLGNPPPCSHLHGELPAA